MINISLIEYLDINKRRNKTVLQMVEYIYNGVIKTIKIIRQANTTYYLD